MRYIVFVLLFSGCAAIHRMEMQAAPCRKYCEDKFHDNNLLVIGKWPCDCVCVRPPPVE